MRRKRGLLRTAARTAVIAGTATSVAGRVQRRQQEKFNRARGGHDAALDGFQPPPASTNSHDVADSLQRLAELKASGALSAKEYAAAKARVFGM